jgi:hypothetical protein
VDYFVSWEIEVEAESPVDAAKLARAAQLEPRARATVFQVFSENAEDPICVDLTAIAEGSQV